jgi:hypothetical protein
MKRKKIPFRHFMFFSFFSSFFHWKLFSRNQIYHFCLFDCALADQWFSGHITKKSSLKSSIVAVFVNIIKFWYFYIERTKKNSSFISRKWFHCGTGWIETNSFSISKIADWVVFHWAFRGKQNYKWQKLLLINALFPATESC